METDMPVRTSAGGVELPIEYADTSYFMAVFRVAHARAQPLMAPFELQAVRLRNAESVAVLMFADYRSSTIGPYFECGLAIAAVPGNANPAIASLLSLWRNGPGGAGLGYAVVHLPVTTGLACAAGREIWGYPKFIAAIQSSLEGREFHGEVAEPATGAWLLRLDGHTGFALPSRPLDVVLYSRLGGSLLAARVETHGMGWLCSPGSIRLSAGPGDHPLERTLDLLDLRAARPAVVFRADALNMRLHGGAAMTAGRDA